MPNAPMDWLPDPARIAANAPRTTWWSWALQFTVGGMIGGGGILIALTVLPALDGIALIGLGLGFAAGLWLQLLIHEGGHALAGVLGGMRLIAIGIGPWRLERDGGGWRAHRATAVHGIGGFAIVLPRDGAPMRRRTQALYLSGGPLSNLLAAALCYALILATGLPEWADAALLGVCAAGVLLGVVNLIPFHSAGFRTDGGGLLDLWRRPALTRAYFGMQQVVAQSLQGRRPREWNLALLPASLDGLAELRLPLASLRLSWAMDTDDEAQSTQAAAAIWSAAHEDGLNAVNQTYAALALVAFATDVRGDATLARAWRERVGAGLLDVSAHCAAADAAIATLQGSPDALRRIQNARVLLPRVHDEGSRIVMAERLQRWEARLADGDPMAGYAAGM